jgi:uncharacterized protein
MEGFLTDGISGDIIRSSMLPAFRRNAYGEGLLAATTEVVGRIARERNVTLANLPEPPPRQATRTPGGGSIVPLIFFILIVLFIMGRSGGRGGRSGRGGGGSGLLGFLIGQAIANAGRRGGGWNGGGFGGGGFGGGMGGGGFGGFGGGRSGGGGASGGW